MIAIATATIASAAERAQQDDLVLAQVDVLQDARSDGLRQRRERPRGGDVVPRLRVDALGDLELLVDRYAGGLETQRV